MKSWLKVKEELAEAMSKVNTGEGVFDRAEIKRIIEMQKKSLREHTPTVKTWAQDAEDTMLPHISKDLSERGYPELAKTVLQNSQATSSMLQEIDSLGEDLGPCGSYSTDPWDEWPPSPGAHDEPPKQKQRRKQ